MSHHGKRILLAAAGSSATTLALLLLLPATLPGYPVLIAGAGVSLTLLLSYRLVIPPADPVQPPDYPCPYSQRA